MERGMIDNEENSLEGEPDGAFEEDDEIDLLEPLETGVTYRRSSSKVGRNEQCPCGSGKKYKKCHGL